MPSEQKEPPETPYKNGDGFELYIDAGRFFPDNCAFVKVIVYKFIVFQETRAGSHGNGCEPFHIVPFQNVNWSWLRRNET